MGSCCPLFSQAALYKKYFYQRERGQAHAADPKGRKCQFPFDSARGH
jgi:hypothetical protein